IFLHQALMIRTLLALTKRTPLPPLSVSMLPLGSLRNSLTTFDLTLRFSSGVGLYYRLCAHGPY
ncbi:MAG: hypothetical protein QXY52_01695, partial [Conexivisphaerales archaeon]